MRHGVPTEEELCAATEAWEEEQTERTEELRQLLKAVDLEKDGLLPRFAREIAGYYRSGERISVQMMIRSGMSMGLWLGMEIGARRERAKENGAGR